MIWVSRETWIWLHPRQERKDRTWFKEYLGWTGAIAGLILAWRWQRPELWREQGAGTVSVTNNPACLATV